MRGYVVRVMELVHAYKSLIDVIVAWAGSAALLHVHVGLAIYLATLAMVRNRRGMAIALQMVMAAELGNELMDWLDASPHWTWADTLSDIVLTLLWPVAITIVVHYRRRRWRRTVARTAQRATISRPTTARASIAST